MFKRAERNKAKLRLGIEGPSGSGKTYGALLIAKGLGGKVAVIDTEEGSASLYADLCEFDVAELRPPFSPERYVELIQQAESAGYDTIIIDSASHEWIGTGGVLEIHDQMPGNSYTNWGKVNPRHEAFVQAILRSKCHVICNFRSKQKHELVESSTGKKEVKKLGMGAQQREGIEYELTTVLTLHSGKATSNKDRTKLFPADHWFTITEDTGKTLATWLNSGSESNLIDISAMKDELEGIQTMAALNNFAAAHKDEWTKATNVDAARDLFRKREAEIRAAQNAAQHTPTDLISCARDGGDRVSMSKVCEMCPDRATCPEYKTAAKDAA